MQVLIVTPAYPAPDHGAYMGVQRNAEGVVTGLHELGVDVKVVTTYWGDDDLPDEVETSEGVPVIRLPDISKRIGRFGRIGNLHYGTFGRALNRRSDFLNEADVVHSLMETGAPSTDTPWVSTHQHWGSSIDSFTDLLHVPFHTAFKNYTYANIDALTVPSTFAGEQLRDELWVEPPPITVVPHGVDTDRFKPGAPEDHQTGTQDVRLMYAGPFEKRKRLQDLVRALGELKQRDVGFEAVLAGKGAKQSRLERMVRQRGMEDDVQFPGYLSDEQLLKEYQRADIFVFPSILEGFGQVLVEAMATNTPPVVCDKPPMNEIVPTDELIVKPRDPDAIADRIEHLVTTGRITSLAKTCREHVDDEYTWNSIASKYLELYQSLQ